MPRLKKNLLQRESEQLEAAWEARQKHGWRGRGERRAEAWMRWKLAQRGIMVPLEAWLEIAEGGSARFYGKFRMSADGFLKPPEVLAEIELPEYIMPVREVYPEEDGKPSLQTDLEDFL